MKKIVLSIVTVLTLNTQSFAFATLAPLLEVMNVANKGIEGIDSVLNLSITSDGISADGRILTDKVADNMTQWVPEPFQDNAKNAVDACLKDLKKSLMKNIKWPSVEICGHDIVADLKADIDDYLGALKLKYGWQSGHSSLVTSRTGKEPTEYLKKKNKEKLKEAINNNQAPADFGIKRGLDNANNSSDRAYEDDKNNVNFDIINYNQTLEDIKNISKGLVTLGVTFNPAIVSSANKQVNENTFIDIAIKRGIRNNQQLLNTFDNILKYKEVAREGGTDEAVENNKILNPTFLKNLVVLAPKNSKVNIAGTSGKTQIDYIGHSVKSIFNYMTEGTSPMLKPELAKEYFKNADETYVANDVDNFNYLVQGVKIYSDTMANYEQLVADNSENGKHRQITELLEGMLKMNFINLAQDYQYGKAMLNISNASDNVQIALLKNIADKIRLLNYTNANLNTVIK